MWNAFAFYAKVLKVKAMESSTSTRSSMDRALVCGTKGCRFDSCRVRVSLTYSVVGLKKSHTRAAPVAQLDRASVFGTEG